MADPDQLAVVFGGPTLDGADGTIAAWATDVVSGLIRGYLPGVQLSPVADVTARFSGSAGRHLRLGVRPLSAVSAVTVDGESLGVDDYTFRRSGVVIRRAGLGWGGVDAEVQLTYSAGFAAVAEDLAAVAQSAAARLMVNPGQWRSLPADGPGPEGQLTAAFPAGFTVAELAVLNRYRRRTW